MPVHALECLAQQLARFAVDAPDGVLERADRFLQIGGLRIEISFSLLARAQLLQRSQVHCAELVDRLRKPGDLALQSRRPWRAFGCACEPLLVGLRLAKLARE